MTTVGDHLTISWEPGRSRRFHWAWLRDSCLCPACRNSNAKQKYFDPAGIPADIRPSAVTEDAGGVGITWPDGHHSRFPAAWLREHPAPGGARPAGAGIERQPWSDGPALAAAVTVPHARLMGDDAVLGRSLHDLFRHGLLVVSGRDVPDADPGRLCERLAGFVDRSYFGEFFDLEVKPDATTDSVSFSTRELPLHTDIPYYTVPPDVQFLFGLDVNAAARAGTSGRTSFVDGLAAALRLRETDPAAFEVLATTEVLYRAEYPLAAKTYQNETTIIGLGPDGEVRRLVNNPTKMFFDNVPFDVVPTLYRSYRALKDLMREPGRAYHHRWHQGDMVVFDNRRVFHGRERFDDPGLRRTLRGGYFSSVELLARARYVWEKRG